jgi:hypothetical protein
MRNQNKNEKKRPVKNKKKKVLPGNEINPPTIDDTSMSAGNLVNNPRGRTKTRNLHTKLSVTGSDNDGQVD